VAGASSLQFNLQAQTDFRRISSQLTNLQGQVASGAKANDLQSYGSLSGQILSAQSGMANADARASVLSELQSRFGVQSAALSQVATGASNLAQAIRDATTSNDGRGINTELDMSFTSIISALNETWQGQPMFAGERQNGKPVKITTLQELQAATLPSDIYDEAARNQTIDLGNGQTVRLAPKASQMSQGLFDAIKDLKNLMDAAGGTLGQPMTDAQIAALTNIADRLDAQANSFTTEEGRTGQIQARLETEQTRLSDRSDLLKKEIGDHRDADLAQVSMQINALLVQYQAAAKTFANLSQLTLLNFLPSG
jgi:flagellar hook-associated protein 3 FlgL